MEKVSRKSDIKELLNENKKLTEKVKVCNKKVEKALEDFFSNLEEKKEGGK